MGQSLDKKTLKAAAPLLVAPGNEFRDFPDHRSIQRLPLPQIWVSTDKLFFAVNVDVPAAPLAPIPPIAPTPPAVRSVAEKCDDEKILRHMKSRKHTRGPDPLPRNIPDITGQIDFEYLDFEGKKRRVVNGKIH